jgi:N6-adenosine-specific RNA methylase IME4
LVQNAKDKSYQIKRIRRIKLKYKTIVIDFPWDIKPMILKKYAKPLPYTTMKDKEIMEFPINDYADKDCDLFLWCTHSTLEQALKLFTLWKFKYHCLLTWDKINGYSVSGFTRKTEFVIYGYKGKMGIKQKGKFIPTLFKESSNGHSKKPRIFYDLLIKSTTGPRIDIFSRKKHQGFDSWGNEAKEPLTLSSFN